MKLNATFGAGYKIYQNDVEQGFKEPCFFIAVLKPDISPLQKNRFMNRNPLDVHYFPTSGRNNAELFAIANTKINGEAANCTLTLDHIPVLGTIEPGTIVISG